jgi:hypothetical protein
VSNGHGCWWLWLHKGDVMKNMITNHLVQTTLLMRFQGCAGSFRCASKSMGWPWHYLVRCLI